MRPDYSGGSLVNLVASIVAARGGAALARRRRGSLTSVFPSTTASAITTSYTGRTPLEHGLTGWFTYFGEAGCVSAALPLRSPGDHVPPPRRGVVPDDGF